MASSTEETPCTNTKLWSCVKLVSYDGGSTFECCKLRTCDYTVDERLQEAKDEAEEAAEEDADFEESIHVVCEEPASDGLGGKPLCVWRRFGLPDYLKYSQVLPDGPYFNDVLIAVERGAADDEAYRLLPLCLGGSNSLHNLIPVNESIDTFWLPPSDEFKCDTYFEFEGLIMLIECALRNTHLVSFLDLQILVNYDDEKYPDKPKSIEYILAAYCDSAISPSEDGLFNDIIKWKKLGLSKPRDNIQNKNIKFSVQVDKKPSSLSVWDFVPIVGSVRTIREGCRDIKEGDKWLGGFKCAMGVAFLASDVAMVGAAGMAIKGLVTGGTRAVGTATAEKIVTEVVKTGSKRTAKRAAQRAAKKAAQKAAEKLAEQTATTLAATSAQQVATEALKQAGKQAAAQSVKNTAGVVTKEAIIQGGKEAAAKTATVIAKESASKGGKEVAKKAATVVAKETAIQGGKEVAKKAVTVIAKETAVQGGKEAVKKVATVTVKQIGKEGVKVTSPTVAAKAKQVLQKVAIFCWKHQSEIIGVGSSAFETLRRINRANSNNFEVPRETFRPYQPTRNERSRFPSSSNYDSNNQSETFNKAPLNQSDHSGHPEYNIFIRNGKWKENESILKQARRFFLEHLRIPVDVKDAYFVGDTEIIVLVTFFDSISKNFAIEKAKKELDRLNSRIVVEDSEAGLML